ncbi:uncharacterized protein LOC130549053 isoform X2 [Triplophysa rosa]|uniref:uncharacterized protein LOC130549053 isoform X2 n=1 Tax=Triplophysa rosa TaxID=992332 RepID=UPI002545C7CD|nr:uncharacterized protein LOC130549053 isoform X2 [Triplophysa rosa]
MELCLIFLSYLTCLIVNGVFGDEVKSVMEGHSVTLNTDVIKHKDDLIVWRYGPENTLLATINGKAINTQLYDGDDGRFRDRLKLNDRTGDLTISDIRTSDSGLYTLKISSNNRVSYKRFNVTVSGVFTGDVKSVSVRTGHSFILYTHVLKERDDVMEWRFGAENTLVAKINETTFTPSTDERFRDRVKRDDQTGALMINDTRSHHSGLYQLRINSNNKVSYKKFDVTIHVHSHVDSRVLWVWVIPVVLLLISICVCVYLHWVCVRKPRGNSNALTDDESSINSSTTLDTEASRCLRSM